jgi:hypothetical protein
MKIVGRSIMRITNAGISVGVTHIGLFFTSSSPTHFGHGFLVLWPSTSMIKWSNAPMGLEAQAESMWAVKLAEYVPPKLELVNASAVESRELGPATT